MINDPKYTAYVLVEVCFYIGISPIAAAIIVFVGLWLDNFKLMRHLSRHHNDLYIYATSSKYGRMYGGNLVRYPELLSKIKYSGDEASIEFLRRMTQKITWLRRLALIALVTISIFVGAGLYYNDTYLR